MVMEASTDLLIQQWRNAPVLRGVVQIWLDVFTEQIETPRRQIALLQQVDQAYGIWLDWLGIRLGIARPSITASALDSTFGFDLAGVGFDQERFGDVWALETKTPLGDGDYRRLIRARGWYDYADATLYWLRMAAREIDPLVEITDNLDMTISIETGNFLLMDLARDFDCLPIPAGVSVTITETYSPALATAAFFGMAAGSPTGAQS